MARSLTIARTYGIGGAAMVGRTQRLATSLLERGVRPTLPVTASVLGRQPEPFRELAAAGAEIAIHGLHHVDHIGLSGPQQVAAIDAACEAFRRAGFEPAGFRAPYLRANEATIAAVARAGLRYDASPALAYPVEGGNGAAYAATVEFQLGRPIGDVPALPWFEQGVVRLPYSLPDDEALDRLGLADPGAAWGPMLRASHERGELLCMGLHPERAERYGPVLAELLDEAARLPGGIWIASLGKIDEWWRARAGARLSVASVDDGHRVALEDAPPDARLALAWPDGRLESIEATGARLETGVRPTLGVERAAPQGLIDALGDLGYAVERSDVPAEHAGWVDSAGWSGKLDRALLAAVDPVRGPLVSIGRWPGGVRSALNVSGDVDALTLLDFVRRFYGR